MLDVKGNGYQTNKYVFEMWCSAAERCFESYLDDILIDSNIALRGIIGEKLFFLLKIQRHGEDLLCKYTKFFDLVYDVWWSEFGKLNFLPTYKNTIIVFWKNAVLKRYISISCFYIIIRILCVFAFIFLNPDRSFFGKQLHNI